MDGTKSNEIIHIDLNIVNTPDESPKKSSNRAATESSSKS